VGVILFLGKKRIQKKYYLYYHTGILGGIMKTTNKKEIMETFEKYLDEIMSKDKTHVYEISSLIKDKVIDLGDKMLEKWSSENISNEKNENKIIKYDKTLKKK